MMICSAFNSLLNSECWLNPIVSLVTDLANFLIILLSLSPWTSLSSKCSTPFVYVLHCMNDSPGFTKLIAIITNNSQRHLKSYLIEAHPRLVTSHFISEIHAHADAQSWKAWSWTHMVCEWWKVTLLCMSVWGILWIRSVPGASRREVCVRAVEEGARAAAERAAETGRDIVNCKIWILLTPADQPSFVIV